MNRAWRIAGINFDHMHMRSLLDKVKAHPNAEIVGISDENFERMQETIDGLGISADRVYTDYERCLEETKPDIVVLCPATAEHGIWTERVAAYGVHIFIEKPFAASLAEADRMIAAVKQMGKELIINWPLRWYPTHMTAKRVIDEGLIGDVIEVHYYDGNRGPLRKMVDGVVTNISDPSEKSQSWWYRKESGGGSMQDYLGYGVTLGTWFMNGKAPIEVTTILDAPAGLEVDEHSITVCRYDTGLSKFETRWGTFTDPWRDQPQPKCGFVLVGTRGTVASYDGESTIRVQTLDRQEGFDIPIDVAEYPFRDPFEYVLDRLSKGMAIEGPLSPAICRIGQQIIETAIRSAAEGRTLPLVP